MKQLLASLLTILFLCQPSVADDETVSLFGEGPTLSWTFNNGPEFGGGGGGLAMSADGGPDGSAALHLTGDFREKGGYVATYVDTPEVAPESIEYELRSTLKATALIRIQDSTGQVHQIRYAIEETDDWQTVQFPIREFFLHMGTTRSIPGIQKYQYWEGAADGKWHGPMKSLGILVSKNYTQGDSKVGEIWIANPRIVKEKAREKVEIKKTLSYTDFAGLDDTGWQFDNGREFKGATGELTLLREPADAPGHLQLRGDFTAGGKYVQALKTLDLPADSTVTELRFKLRSRDVVSYGLRLIDGTGQVHQKRINALTADGEWHQVTINPAEFAGGEHWSGANDGKWHGTVKTIAFLLSERSDTENTPVLEIADVEVDATLTVETVAASLVIDFETERTVPADWTVEGDVTLVKDTASSGKRSMRLKRTTATIDDKVQVVTRPFACSPGAWEFSLQARSALESPDASFSGSVHVDFLNAAGDRIASNELLNLYGTHDWQATTRVIDAPAGSSSAQLRVRLNKAVGEFWLDDLKAVHQASDAFAEKRINRILWSTAELGNLLYPEQPVIVSGEVEVHAPLTEAERVATFTLRDYWGVEQGPALTATLERDGRAENGLLLYRMSVDVSELRPDLYRYYELHVQIPQRGQAAFRDYTAFARLPQAETKAFKPEEVPFTSRNWDNRIPAYFYLTDRIGIRTIGLWGDWKATPPYENKAPRIELAQELGLTSISRTPIIAIERRAKGHEAYTEEVLRAGTRKFLADYMPMGLTMISLGNEPRVGHERAPGNVEAYKVVYDEIKKINPDIIVVGTSSGTEEAFFEAGFQDYLDVYDFHVYESYKKLDRVFARYEELFEKYDCRKPIWSTELGLNSQGMTRHAVAVEMMKKLPVFFALGGENVSWFGLVYPDPTGRARGASGDSHNVFDCRYNRYSPRLDAVMYYTMVNAIGRKAFVQERQYDGELRGFHFRSADGKNLQVWWSESERRDVAVPLPGVTDVTLVRVDSSRRTMPANGALTVSVTDEPILLLYDDPADGPGALPEALIAATLTVDADVPAAAPGTTATVTLTRRADWTGTPTVALPPGWTSRIATVDQTVTISVDIPATTSAVALQLRVACDGEVTVPIPIAAPTTR